MTISNAVLCYICFTMTTVLSFPNFRQEKQLQEVNSYCDSLVLKTALENKRLTDRKDIDDLIKNIPNEGTYQNSGFYEDDSIGQGVYVDSEGLLNRLLNENELNEDEFNRIDSEIYISKFKDVLSRMRKNCISSILRSNIGSEPNEKERTVDSSLTGSSFSNTDLQTVLNRDLLQSNSNKRANLALNPTGWRKRRSGDNNDRRDENLQQIVRQLLEKRQRLEFNPTGW